jgi:phage shock protein PspC (stress-responsive transcriptional regulator)
MDDSHIPRRANDEDAVVLGVCAGLADHFDRDATLVRIALIVFFIVAFFPTLFAYFILALFMRNPQKEITHEDLDKDECPYR